MAWHINAWIEDGQSFLEIIDAQSGRVHVRWSTEAGQQTTADMHRLYRDLLLLSCKQDYCNGRLFCAGPIS